ncbi:MAG: hypothetical protein ACU837_09460 [Gammaproteobacteria bacterium]
MKQSKLAKMILVSSVLFFSGGVVAEGKIIDKSDIVGTWEVTGTAPSLDEPKRKSTEEWEFAADGSFTLTSVEHRVNGRVESHSKYTVSSDTIKIDRPGRPGKYYTYEVQDKSAAEMVLKGGLEGFYFLKKK